MNSTTDFDGVRAICELAKKSGLRRIEWNGLVMEFFPDGTVAMPLEMESNSEPEVKSTERRADDLTAEEQIALYGREMP